MSEWARIKEVFALVADLPAEQRIDALERECGSDVALRSEVESLLASDSNTPALLDQAAHDAFTDLAVEPEMDGIEAGMEIRRYRMVERLGAGGMGTVWKAEDTRRENALVAIKFVRPGMSAPSLLARFDNERRLMAHLDHPNIARLLDGGMTEEGRPFLVVEFVNGTPIDRWCEEQDLSVNERVALFRKVCAAAHYAHRNLIIHRDLKPGNVMVTAEGEPKLLDFGISKIVHPDTGLATATIAEWRPMTPQYASPEQIRGEPMTTASDIYSLGIMLYELLTGKRPYEVPSAWRPEAERVITESNPPTPSSASGIRQLAGDLDNIILMALRKEPERRYSSAEQLAEDLDRFLGGLPVRARPETLIYRLSKLWHRQKLVVSGTAGLILALVGGSLAINRQARIAGDERDFAQAEAESLHRVVDFLTDLFRSVDPSQHVGEPPSSREMLERGLEGLRGDESMTAAVRSALLLSIGQIYLELGETQSAIEPLEEAHRLRLEVYGPEHVEIAESRNALGRLRYAQGRFPEAEEHLRAAHRMWTERWGAEHLDVASACNNLGLVLRDSGALEAATVALEQAVAVREKLLGSGHQRTLAARNNLAGVRYSLGDLEGAEQLLRQVVAGNEALARGENDLALSNSLNNLGLMLHEQDLLDEALPVYERSFAMRKALLDPGHPHRAISLNNLGGLLYQKGDAVGAEARFRQAIEEFLINGAEDHPTLAQLRMNLARALRDQRRNQEARELLEPILETQRQKLPPGHPLLSSLLVVYGGVLADLEEFDLAIGVLEEARDLAAQEQGPKEFKLDVILEELARIEELQGGGAAPSPDQDRD